MTVVTDDHQVLSTYIGDFAHELNDRASLAASTTRAVNLFRDSGLSRQQFIQHLYAARQITQQRTASIRSVSRNSESTAHRKHKMAYFFAVVEDLLVPDQLPTSLPATASVSTADVPSMHECVQTSVPVTTDPPYHESVLEKRWRLAANELADQMTSANHQQWIVPLELLDVTNDHALLRSPSATVCAYVQSRLAETVARALRVKVVEIQT